MHATPSQKLAPRTATTQTRRPAFPTRERPGPRSTVEISRRSKPQLTGEQTAQACDIACFRQLYWSIDDKANQVVQMMQSEIIVGQRFKFNILSDTPSHERQAGATCVPSHSDEGLVPKFHFSVE